MKSIITYTLAGIGLVSILTSITPNHVDSKNKALELGPFSISLAVSDIDASYQFYQKLGFEKIDGSNDQNWIILKNGVAKIGLFQDMFPKNTITFNPSDVRTIFKEINNENIETTFSMGMDRKEGPCTFSIMDPDGNPILVDQH